LKIEIEAPTHWDVTNRNGAWIWTKVWYLSHQKSFTSKYNNHRDQSNIKCGIETRKPWEKLQGFVKPKK
jgi:hypothetical protein